MYIKISINKITQTVKTNGKSKARFCFFDIQFQTQDYLCIS